jgi:hypothetical protein
VRRVLGQGDEPDEPEVEIKVGREREDMAVSQSVELLERLYEQVLDLIADEP